MWKDDCYEIRASQDLRIIGRLDGGDLCCYHVAHHDKALRAAERGIAGGVDLSRVKALASTARPTDETPMSPNSDRATRTGPLAKFDNNELLEHFGVPPEWIEALRSLQTQEQFLAQSFEDILSENAWMELGEQFPATPKISTGAIPTFRVASQRVARMFVDGEVRALQYNLPASSWALIEREAASPSLVRGGPGSGKTLVAIYRAIHVLKPEGGLGIVDVPRVLYVTFTNSLVQDASDKFERLLGRMPANLKLTTVDSLANAVAPRGTTLYENEQRLVLARKAAQETPGTAKLNLDFFLDEVDLVIGDRMVQNLDDYLSLERTGRGRRLTIPERRSVWELYDRYRAQLEIEKRRDRSMLMSEALEAAKKLPEASRYDLVVIDEIQDLAPAQIAFLLATAKGEGRTKHVMMVGDAGQSIYRSGFRWADVGLRIGGGNVFKLGRSERSTTEILSFASALAGPESEPETDDSAGLPERHGPLPSLGTGFRNRQAQAAWLAEAIKYAIDAGERPERIAVVCRTVDMIKACAASLRRHGLTSVTHGETGFYKTSAVKLITAHSAKGLEFANVYVIGADDDSYPMPYIQVSEDERSELQAQDRKLLYVACTRACDRLTVLTTSRPSPFLPKDISLRSIVSAPARYADSQARLDIR